MSLELALAIASFSFALGELAVHFFARSGPFKERVTIVVVVLLTVTTGAFAYDQYRHAQLVDRTAADIVTVIGNERKTFDEIYEGLFYVDFAVANEALDRLIDQRRVGHSIITIGDASGAVSHRVRSYYAKSFD